MPSYGYRQNYSDLFFTPTYNQPVAPIDLEQLATSYDTLQKRHDTAVTTLSAYKTALSELDLNPAESEYINNLATELDRSLVDNANYNNLGFGLNALIKQYGDIMSNQGLRGRLDAQRDWKAFNTAIDENNTLSADTKQYLKENNKYNYTPSFDENGREIKGSTWQPTINPVNTVSHSSIVALAVQMAAEEEGKGNQVRFLDANGNITTDPSKAVDGEVYSNTTSSWKRLTKEKINQALQTVLSDSSIAESLDQDYRVALWKKQKEGSNPLVEDANGIALTKDEYIQKSLEGGVNAATYDKVQTTVDYSNLAKAKVSYAQGNLRANDITGFGGLLSDNIDGSLSGYAQPMEIEYQLGNELSAAKEGAMSNIVSLLGENLTGKDLMEFISRIEKADDTELDNIYNDVLQQIPEQNRERFTNRYKQFKRDLVNARINYESQFEGLSADQRSVADFAIRAGAGTGFTKGASKYDDDILLIVDSIFGNNGEYMDIEVGDDKNYNNLKYLLGDNFESGTKNNGTKYYRLYKKDYNKIGLFAKAADITDERGWFMRTFGGDAIKAFVYDKNGNIVNLERNIQPEFSKYPSFQSTYNYSKTDRLKDINNIIKSAQKTMNETTNITRNVLTGNVLTGRISGKDYAAYQKYQQGYLKIDDYDKIVDKDIMPELKRVASTFDASQGDMWAVNDDDTRSTRIVSAKERQDIQKTYNNALNHNAQSIQYQVVDNGITGPAIDISYPVYDNDGKVTDKRQHFVTTALNDPILEQIGNSSTYRNNKRLTQLGLTGKTHTLINDGDIAGFGTNTLQGLSENMFTYNIDGNQVATLTKAEANRLMQAIDNYFNLRYRITSNDIANMNQADATAFTNTLIDIATKIAAASKGVYTPQQILEKLRNDFVQ